MEELIDFFAPHPHYLDHVAPIWRRLPPERRGRFYTTQALEQRAELEGIEPTIAPVPTDVDRLIAVAGGVNLRQVLPRRAVYVAHGTGQTYSDRHISYAGGKGRENAVLFLSPGRFGLERNLEAYPHARAVAVGSPRLDRWLPAERFERPADPVVAISFHWDCRLSSEARSAFGHYRSRLRELAKRFQVLGHGHPRALAEFAGDYLDAGIEIVRDFEEVLARADLYVVDNSSTLYEFAATGRPVVVLNAPWYRKDMEHGLRFWTHADVGVQVDGPEQLGDAIELALTDPEEIATRREEIVDDVFAFRDGKASERAAAEIVKTLEEVG